MSNFALTPHLLLTTTIHARLPSPEKYFSSIHYCILPASSRTQSGRACLLLRSDHALRKLPPLQAFASSPTSSRQHSLLLVMATRPEPGNPWPRPTPHASSSKGKRRKWDPATDQPRRRFRKLPRQITQNSDGAYCSRLLPSGSFIFPCMTQTVESFPTT